MVRRSTKRKRGVPRRAGRRGRIAIAAALCAAVATTWLVTLAEAGMSAHAFFTTPAVALLSDVPSHDGVYRASIVPSNPVAPHRSAGWTLEVRTAAGAPVADAVLALESWMPEAGRVAAVQPLVTVPLGEGRYRVEGLRFDERGWWNVKLRIAAASGTDSLAFNLVF